MKNQLTYLKTCILCAALALTACTTTKNTDANLPKDISERPVDENSQKYDQAQLDKLKASIQNEINKVDCTGSNEWTFSPIGAKACGGPQSYIAYPKKIEDEILPKINDYTEKVKAFNEKYKLISDCMMVMPPKSVKCVDGKPELVPST
ncbi:MULTISPECIES: hypothetical protein [Chryseobacterium]|uniref:Skp family chaperone for outer membrane proteins n=1 Tax=Chryseobacterium camelliae TaxID=1265445 RepID=A0ABU0TK66_9FLAO|nr:MULTISPECIES: hypothetical protein [Chryseobacterium]MDT3408715.1 Skp family chaperone for outer membrane proteins [Pseudacidovorax intermedius]MDQ1097432.1 Skp family chaperone for outer membrane proteins [Chryseobacterium camelliae]MDQ1101360.1 Skp family chaperone for outer membrane proteins [Chryseobacterium sp. SORGH_AS_1048]MDR6084805.1 Skp family chaperone for outer membrane proteins [Chryseobacterium sp. SORGH_AS_0909]MDR6129152.1 Skp family chaperone for outer membrane proteins [Ch